MDDTDRATDWHDVVNAGIESAMNERGAAAGCEPLYWTLDSGAIGHDGPTAHPDALIGGMVNAGVRDADVPAALAKWAQLLGLDGDPTNSAPGILQYEVPIHPRMVIKVWGIVDPDVFAAWAAQQ